RVQEALNRALADLMDARPQDVNATQQQARRELERLQQALNGQKPADEQARDLAQRQRELTEEAKQAAANPRTTPQKQQQLQQKQQNIAEEAGQVRAGEQGQAEKKKATEAVARAQRAGKAEDRARAQREAADALRDLADKVARGTAKEQNAEAPRKAAQQIAQ